MDHYKEEDLQIQSGISGRYLAVRVFLQMVSAVCLYLTSNPFYSFLTGVFGGWDNNTMQEFDKASNMVTLVKPLARMLYKSAYYGSKHSLFNLHNKYIIDIYEEAIKEAKDLTAKKKQLVL